MASSPVRALPPVQSINDNLNLDFHSEDQCVVIGLGWVVGRESPFGWQHDETADEDPVPVAGCD